VSPGTVEAYLHEHIPLSADMGVRVLEADSAHVLLEAPLEPNLNHRATAFGGSVAALGILAGWTLVHLRLREEGHEAQAVIQESSVRYDRPIQGPFRALSGPIDDPAWRRFTSALTRFGKARIEIAGTILAPGIEGTAAPVSSPTATRAAAAELASAARCTGSYVAVSRG